MYFLLRVLYFTFNNVFSLNLNAFLTVAVGYHYCANKSAVLVQIHQITSDFPVSCTPSEPDTDADIIEISFIVYQFGGYRAIANNRKMIAVNCSVQKAQKF